MKQNLFGLMLATTVAVTSLAGCNVPMQTKLGAGAGTTTTTQPGAQTGTKPGGALTGGTKTAVQLAPAKQAAATTNTQATAEAMADAKEMDAYDTMASQEEAAIARYSVSALRADGSVIRAEDGQMVITSSPKGDRGGARGEAKIEFKGKLKAEAKKKLEERHGKLAEKAAKQLEKMKGDRDKLREKIKGAWVANGDGTETKSFSFDTTRTVNGKTMARSVKMERTRNAESKDLLKAHIEFAQTLPNGTSRTSVRDKVVAEDGTATVTFHSAVVMADGTTRTADWTKTITADGQVSGTGTILWAGKINKTITITFGGTEETETATATDTESQTVSEVTASVDGTIAAEAKDSETGDTTAIDTSASTEAGATGGTNQGIAVGEPAPGTSPDDDDDKADDDKGGADDDGDKADDDKGAADDDAADA